MKTERYRIEKDLQLFEENISKLENPLEKSEGIIDLAKRYCEDARYYLGNEDLFTAFGCINYAHGLLDAVIKLSQYNLQH